jgi:hypothetical protein
MPWRRSVKKACFRNAAMYALEHPGMLYVEGYATCYIPVHHAWCVSKQGTVQELTWDKKGAAYFGVSFNPALIIQGAVLFNPEREDNIYLRPLKPERRKHESRNAALLPV